jgi:Response regulator receiver domain
VTDIMMPGMNGFELATALHCDLRTRHVPVIGLTAHWTPEVRERAADAAMHAVLLKPCVPSHLIAELERVLELARGSNHEPLARPVNTPSFDRPPASLAGGLSRPDSFLRADAKASMFAHARRDCSECGLKNGMKLQDIVPSSLPLADPLHYICVHCGAELRIPPPPSQFPRI